MFERFRRKVREIPMDVQAQRLGEDWARDLRKGTKQVSPQVVFTTIIPRQAEELGLNEEIATQAFTDSLYKKRRMR